MNSRHRVRIVGWAILFGLACLTAALSRETRPPDWPATRSALIARAIGRRQAIVLVASARTGRLLGSHDLRDARRLRLLPGSAIKPWTALALLRAGVVTARDRIECRRVVPAFGPRFACSHPPLKRPIGLRTALAQSCNYFFLTVLERLSRAAWTDTLAGYGLRPDRDSSARPLPLMAIGAEGIHVTPWNLLQAWRQLVWRMSHNPGRDLQLVRQGLVECVRSGTGQAAQAPGWRVMGKTGTVAEIPDGRTHAWFLAAAPADHPRIVLLVATARGSGERDAAVIAGRLIRGWLPWSRTHDRGNRDSSRMREVSTNPHAQAHGMPASDAFSDAARPDAGTARGVSATDERMGEQFSGTLPGATVASGKTTPLRGEGAQDEFLLQLLRPVSGLRVQVQSSAPIEFHSGDLPLQARTLALTAERQAWNVTLRGRQFRLPVEQLELHSAAPIRLTFGARRLTVPHELILRRHGDRGEALTRLGMEAYVAGVVNGEASGMPYAAQQAMAVLARTWARSHRGRHHAQGFDFCSTTHCQVWRWSPANSAPWRAAVSTRGDELDYHGQPVRVFYSANCGGETEAGGPPWTPHPEPYLIAQPDPYCLRHPRRWRFRIREERMARWLVRKGLFQHQPTNLRIHVAARDRSGRALWLRLSGPPVRMVAANSFRFTVDRSFGWNRIESTLFTVSQANGYIIFSGRGLGHGVGLCQAGASAMARHGMGWHAILAHYFPGTQVVVRHSPDSKTGERTSPGSADGYGRSNGKAKSPLKPVSYRIPPVAAGPSRHWRFLVDGSCKIRYDGIRPAGVIEWCPRLLERAQTLLDRRARGSIRLIVYATPAEFIGATGEPGWKAAVTRGRTIRLQPEWWLRRRGRLHAVLQHELLLAVMQPRLRTGVDACEQEGLVLALTGEGSHLATVKLPARVNEAGLNERLLGAHSAGQFSSALAACYQVAQRKLRKLGKRPYLQKLMK